MSTDETMGSEKRTYQWLSNYADEDEPAASPPWAAWRDTYEDVEDDAWHGDHTLTIFNERAASTWYVKSDTFVSLDMLR